MKRVRIMLTLVAVLGTVGGVLAFKASRAGGFDFCYRTGSPGTCISSAYGVNNKTVPGLGYVYYTRTTNPTRCTLATCTIRILGIGTE